MVYRYFVDSGKRAYKLINWKLLEPRFGLFSKGGQELSLKRRNPESTKYRYGDGKTSDSANFGIFKQNWFMIRTSAKKYANLTAKDYHVGDQLNKSLSWDIEVLHASQQTYEIDKWFAGHRNGKTGVSNPNTADIATYKNAVYWIRDQIKSDPKYLKDDTRFFVKVQAI